MIPVARPIDLTADQARAIALRAQGFIEPITQTSPAQAVRLGPERKAELVRDMVTHLSAIQLDTISVLARSHELVAYARFGGIGRAAVEQGYWDGDSSFEYWSHAACILPMELWPLFAFRRREYQRRGIRWHDVSKDAVRAVRRTLRSSGPLTTKELGGAKKAGEWWDWSDSKIAVEFLLDTGEVVCTRRVGWRRVYDLAERAIPEDVAAIELTDEECIVNLVRRAGTSLGVGTLGDIADVHRLNRHDVRAALADTGLVAVQVHGWNEPGYADPDALEALNGPSRMRHRTTLLSPFDSLIWHRPRVARMFGMEHRLEAYTPKAKRQHGYFAMPVLHGGRLVARVDPGRTRTALVAKQVTFDSVSKAGVLGTARALREAATWVGLDLVHVEEVRPAHLRSELVAALGD